MAKLNYEQQKEHDAYDLAFLVGELSEPDDACPYPPGSQRAEAWNLGRRLACPDTYRLTLHPIPGFGKED